MFVISLTNFPSLGTIEMVNLDRAKAQIMKMGFEGIISKDGINICSYSPMRGFSNF